MRDYVNVRNRVQLRFFIPRFKGLLHVLCYKRYMSVSGLGPFSLNLFQGERNATRNPRAIKANSYLFLNTINRYRGNVLTVTLLKIKSEY